MDDDKLQLDYEETNRYFRMLTDIRFKLLAFVPTVSGIAVTLVSGSTTPEVRLSIGLFGLLVTNGHRGNLNLLKRRKISLKSGRARMRPQSGIATHDPRP